MSSRMKENKKKLQLPWFQSLIVTMTWLTGSLHIYSDDPFARALTLLFNNKIWFQLIFFGPHPSSLYGVSLCAISLPLLSCIHLPSKVLSTSGGDNTTDRLISTSTLFTVSISYWRILTTSPSDVIITCLRGHNPCYWSEGWVAAAAVSHIDWWSCPPVAVKVRLGGARVSETPRLADRSAVWRHQQLSPSPVISL